MNNAMQCLDVCYRRLLPRRLVRNAPSAVLVVLWSLTPTGLLHAEPSWQYNRDIRPILAENCFACHGADSAARKADLRIDQRETAIDFGAIEPGEPESSELIARIFSDDPDLIMPPAETKKTLTGAQKEMLKQWIADGAIYQRHWSLIEPQKSQPPAVENAAWLKNAIDQFVLAKLEHAGLKPADEAAPHVLFRRLHLDITGLPPRPESLDAFVAEYRADPDVTLSRWIDDLMDSPAWGEHRARYWLDAARYADTHGLHFDNYREMWPYRDWVIQAFNSNQPFDQFTVEQLAGDLLPQPTDSQLIATGLQRCNMTTNEGGTIDEENMALYATDRVQTFGWVFLGLTTNCAQCHDHKFDPISTRDYYSLAAFFRNTTQQPKDGNVEDGRGPILVIPSDADLPRWKSLPAEIASAKALRDERKEKGQDEFQRWLANSNSNSLAEDIPREGLVIHLPLDEGAGNEVSSSSDSDAKFTATGDVTWIADGKLGPAPVIKAAGTFDLGPIGDFQKNQSFSYGAWIRPGKEISGAIIAKMDEQSAYRGWDLWQEGKSLAVHLVDAWPDNALKMMTRQPVLKIGQWQHVFATYDGSGKPEGIKIYVDGKLEALKAEAKKFKPQASIQTTTSLRLGQRSKGHLFEDGAIQDVRVYDRALTEEEVRTLVEAVPLQYLLATGADQRTEEQTAALYDYYLRTRDAEFPGLSQAIVELEAEYEAIRERSPLTHIQEERKDSEAMAHILIRGEYDRPAEQVPAATPEALHPMPKNAPNNRLGLAQWLLDPANPLTARVTVNRFWQELFGRGLVVTPEDFGVMGAMPSHPELLDWLAVDFRESGWDVKRIFKRMLMSATYRQASITSPEKLERDRDNALLSRGPRFRMDAEMLRDYALSVSGLLAGKMYGPSVRPYQPEAIWEIVGLPNGNTRNYVPDQGESLYRRTLYTFWKRMAPPPNLEAFNAPSREVCMVRRERTNTPLQALVTLNDPLFFEAARCLAEHALQSCNDEPQEVLQSIAKRVLCRPLSEVEQKIVFADHAHFLNYYQSRPTDASALVAMGDSKVAPEIDAPQLAAWTMVCSQLMNLDETINK